MLWGVERAKFSLHTLIKCVDVSLPRIWQNNIEVEGSFFPLNLGNLKKNERYMFH